MENCFEQDTVVDAIASGRMVIVGGSQSGAFIMMDAAAVTADAINLMAIQARGITGLAITHRQAVALGLTLQPRRGSHGAPQYTTSIEAVRGVSSGISAQDRATTVLAAACGSGEDITTPGHVFPHVPTGNPDGMADLALHLCALAGCRNGAVTSGILDNAGAAASDEFATALAARLGLTFVTAQALTGM